MSTEEVKSEEVKSEEVKLEEPQQSVAVEKTIVEIVKLALSNEEHKKKISIELTPQAIFLINLIISHTPNTLLDLEKATMEIIKDSKIDTKDIPQFIIIVQRIYQIIYNSNNANGQRFKYSSNFRIQLTKMVAKFLIHVLIEEERIKVEDQKKAELIKQCDDLIEACASLIMFPKSLKKKGCLKSIFG